MALQGNLSTMSLSDLLRWAGADRQTGILELERNKVCKKIVFREGRIVACSTNDPSSLIGQFLLARGRITKEQLSKALAAQEQSGKSVGQILLANGVLTQEDLASDVAAKAEENIYGLFDWGDAFFRYEEHADPGANLIDVDFAVDDIVEKGIKRREQLQRIRDAFPSSGVVLGRTEKPTQPEVMGSGLATSILQSIDGRRTVAEILLRCRASEFLVLRFLFTLYLKELVRITEVQQIDPGSPTLLDEGHAAPAGHAHEGAAASHEKTHPGETAETLERYPEVAQQLELGLHFMSQGEFEAALQVLDHCYRAHPGDDYLRHLMNKAESALLEKVRKEDLLPSRIPVVQQGQDPAALNLQPSELFLLGMIDGVSDIKTLLWVAPMRELDVYTTLRQLMQQGLIELREPEGGSEQPVDSEQPAVRWA